MISVVKLLRQTIKNEDLRFNIKLSLDKYKIGPGKYYKYKEKLLFCKQIGGIKKVIKLEDNKEYEYHIDGVSVSKATDNEEYEINFITLDETYDGCASLIYIVNEDKIIIESITNLTECIKCLDKEHKYKVGNILMQIILTYSKRKFPNAKYFELSDRSVYNCYGNSIKLSILRTMIYGEPYYCKFGFRPITKENYNIYKKNKNIFNTDPTITLSKLNQYLIDDKIIIKESDLKKHIISDPLSIKSFMKSLMDEQTYLDEKKNQFENYDRDLTPYEIKELKEINKKREILCSFIYNIYEKLFNYAKYTRYNNNIFYLKIKK
jgi:hypothetical protein